MFGQPTAEVQRGRSAGCATSACWPCSGCRCSSRPRCRRSPTRPPTRCSAGSGCPRAAWPARSSCRSSASSSCWSSTSAIFVVVLRLLSGCPMPWRDLRPGGRSFGAVGVGVLKVAVSYGIVGSSTNPVLASFAIIIGLLLVINLMSRVTLLAAAWAAVGEPAQAGAVATGRGGVATVAHGCRTRARWSRPSAPGRPTVRRSRRAQSWGRSGPSGSARCAGRLGRRHRPPPRLTSRQHQRLEPVRR